MAHVGETLHLLKLDGLPAAAAHEQVVDVGDGVGVLGLLHALVDDGLVLLDEDAVLEVHLEAGVLGVQADALLVVRGGLLDLVAEDQTARPSAQRLHEGGVQLQSAVAVLNALLVLLQL